MRVRLNTLMAGPEGVTPKGAERDVDADEAAALVSGGYAVAVEEAIAMPPEMAGGSKPGAGGAPDETPAPKD